MKTKFLFFTLLIIFCIIKITSAQITFQKTFGGTDYDYGSSIQQTADGGFIIAGSTRSFAVAVDDVYLIRTDATGNSLWTKTFGGTFSDEGSFVQQTSDGGFIIAGYTSSFGAGDYDFFLIRADSNGDTLWTKTFGGTNSDFGYAVQQTADGGFIIAGTTNNVIVAPTDVFLIRTDSTGNTLWSKTFGGTGNDYGNFVKQTSDGGFIIAGSTGSFGAGISDVYLIRTDSTGNTIWTKTFGGTNIDYGYAVQQTTDGGFIIAGYTSSFGAGEYDVYLIKTDSSGNTLWTKTYGGTGYDYANSIQQTTDGGFIIAGSTGSFSTSNDDVYLIRTDPTGDTLWTKTFGATNIEFGSTVNQTADGGFIIVGRTNSFGAGNYDVYLIKTDSMGHSGCNEGNTSTIVTTPATITYSPVATVTSPATIVGNPATQTGSGAVVTALCTSVGIEELSGENLFFVSPNPFSNQLSLKGTKEKGEIILFDVMGKEILRLKTFEEETTLSTEKISSGFYLLHYSNGKTNKNFKVVKNNSH